MDAAKLSILVEVQTRGIGGGVKGEGRTPFQGELAEETPEEETPEPGRMVISPPPAFTPGSEEPREENCSS